MNLKDVVSLSDRCRYVVVAKTIYEGKTYYYLIDLDKDDNVKFGYQDNDEFVEVTDPDLLKKLISIFGNQAIEILESLKEE